MEFITNEINHQVNRKLLNVFITTVLLTLLVSTKNLI